MSAWHDSAGLRLFASRHGRTADAVDEPHTQMELDEAPVRPDHDGRRDSAARPFAVLRAFSIISLIAIAVAAVLFAMCYRYIAIQSITHQAEASNAVIAQAALGGIHEEIATYVHNRAEGIVEPFPEDVRAELHDLIRDTRLRKMKVYDAHGTVVFSTKSEEIGHRQPENPGVISALAGTEFSRLIYRDSFNRFDTAGDEDNLIQTYIPLQRHHSGPIVGVFEIYTDVSPMVADSEQSQLIIVGTATLIMVLLYVSLLAIVRRIEKVIDLQQDALRDRSDVLAALSARMLDAQESEKRRIAAELHERVAQTLSAVKLSVETALVAARRGSGEQAAMLESMVPALQAATQDVRAVAVGLRPSSLDDLGLIATLRWLCREFREKHPQVDLQVRLDLEEEQIPVPLRSIIYRVVEEGCAAVSADPRIRRVALALAGDADTIVLTLRDDASKGDLGRSDHPYATARERTLLSGGKFSSRPNSWGGLLIRASWLR